MQFAVLYWFKAFMHRDEPEQDLFELGTLRMILTVQAILSIYLFYVSFYSKSNDTWDRIGYWFHLIAALLVYFILPVTILVVIGLYAEDTFKTALGPSLCATGVTNFLVAIWGLIRGRKDYIDTYKWYKVRQ